MGVTSMFCPGQSRNGRLSWMGHMDGVLPWKGIPVKNLEKWQNPIHVPGQNPIHVPGQNPIHVPGQNLIHVPGQTPIHVPGQNPIHDRRPFLFCPGAKHRRHTHATPTSQPLSGITPPPFTFAPALARAYAWAKAGTFLKVFDGNTLP